MNQLDVKIAFEKDGKVLSLDKILPRKQCKNDIKMTPRYKRILTSIKVIGIVEPLLVFPNENLRGQYILLDGHLRLEALKDLGEKDTFCLIAKDDEAFTYNHHVCLMTAIQEHFMIARSIAKGVSKEKIAEMLCLDVNTIQVKQGLLKGVCSEAIELLKDRPVARGALKELRHVNPMRQIEISELMITSNNFTAGYAQCLVAATPNNQLTIPAATKLKKQFTAEELSRIEREMASIGKEMRSLEDTHGKNVLILVVIVSYLRRLLANANIVKYLARRHPDLLTQFQSLTETTSLDDTSGEQLAPTA